MGDLARLSGGPPTGRGTFTGRQLDAMSIERREDRMSEARSFLTARWIHLAMLNYEVDPSALRKLGPTGTDLDAFDGETFISMMSKTELAGASCSSRRSFHARRSPGSPAHVRRELRGALHVARRPGGAPTLEGLAGIRGRAGLRRFVPLRPRVRVLSRRGARLRLSRSRVGRHGSTGPASRAMGARRPTRHCSRPAAPRPAGAPCSRPKGRGTFAGR